nr:S24 family peptidase [Roseibaca domitiana]
MTPPPTTRIAPWICSQVRDRLVKDGDDSPAFSHHGGTPQDCLWDAGIRDGDLIAVDRAGKRRVGRAVLAVVDGAVTAKILRKRDGRYYLAPANSQGGYPEIALTPESDIWGVIAGVVRRYDLA